MKLNEKEINLLIGAVTTGRFKGAKKGNRFVSEADVYKSFSKELRILEKPINITGVEKDFIKAFETKLFIDTPLMDEETLEVLYNEEPASEMLKLLSTKRFLIELLKPMELLLILWM